MHLVPKENSNTHIYKSTTALVLTDNEQYQRVTFSALQLESVFKTILLNTICKKSHVIEGLIDK